MRGTPIYLADAGSTDSTINTARIAAYENGLTLHVVGGGLPAAGRNIGAFWSKSVYLLFLDADVELQDPTFIRRVIDKMDNEELDCATTDIHTPNGALLSKLMYFGNNICQRASRFFGIPYSTGMCMFFRRSAFDALRGFNDKAQFAEDFMLSRNVSPKRFRVIRGGVATSDRRMQKMGHWQLAKLFVGTALLSGRESQFTKDHGYWK
jgi:glycosyltransferase involved in cell wall biosynthesis